MRYRVVEDMDAPPDQRYQVQRSCYGHIWGNAAPHEKFPDQVSAEICMEKLATGPRVVAEAED